MIRIVKPFESQNRAQAVNQLSQKGVTLLPGVILEVPIVCELHEQETHRAVDGAPNNSRLGDEISQFVWRVFVHRKR